MRTETYYDGPVVIASTALQDCGKLGGAVWLWLLVFTRVGSRRGTAMTDAEVAEALGGISPKLVAQWRDALVRHDYISAEFDEQDQEWAYRLERGRCDLW